MINQFNAILTSCVRCNTDVKYIGLNKNDFLALMYYISNYITKAGLEFTNGDTLRKATLSKAASTIASCTCGINCTCGQKAPENMKERARSLILKCFIATSGQQEISAPQVAALILGIGKNGECYSSHKFGILHYGSFMGYLQRQMNEAHNASSAIPEEDDQDTDEEDTWMEAFQAWSSQESVVQDTLKTIANIELLHKAKIQAQQEAINRQEQGPSPNGGCSTRIVTDLNQFIGFDSTEGMDRNVEEEDIICPNLLEMAELGGGETQNDYVTSAIQHLESLGMFDTASDGHDEHGNSSAYFDAESTVSVDRNLQIWLRELQIQRTMKLMENYQQVTLNVNNANAHLNSECTETGQRSNGVHPDQEASLVHPRTLTEIAQQHTLNDNQELAFKMISHHLNQTVQNNRAPPRQMTTIIIGEAGTGKTHMLNCVIDYFKSLNQRHILRVAAPTGSAALNLQGSTVHTLINKYPNKDTLMDKDMLISKNTKSILESQLKHCQYLILDEFSMCGASLLGELHEALCVAKNSEDTSVPFAGVSVVFAGDLMQFDPVRDSPLYTMQTRNINQGNTAKRVNAIRGHAIYMEVTNVVILTVQCRQTEDPTLYGLLQDIRNETWNSTNYAIMESRLLQYHPEVLANTDQVPTFIVSRNDLRCAINQRMIRKYAQQTGQSLQTVVAIDNYQRHNVDGPLKNALAKHLDDSKTARLVQCLELCPGCPVILTQNVSTELGLVNGTMGIFQKLVHDPQAKSKLKYYALVKFESFSGQCSGLPKHSVPVQAVSRPFKFPMEGKKITISRTQIPISAAFSISDYRSQGKTLANVCIDLKPGMKKKNHASPYVMISRTRTLQDLFILRPFPNHVLNVKWPLKLKEEISRLEALATETAIRYYTDVE